MGDVDGGNVKAKASIEYDGSGLKQMKEDLGSLPGMVDGLGGSAEKAGEALSGLDESMAGSAGSAKSFTTALAELPKMTESGSTSISEMTGALSEHQAVIEETGAAYESLQKPVENTVSMLQEAAPPMMAISKNAESMQSQLSAVHENFSQLGESLTQSIPMLPQFAESMHSVSESFNPSAFGLDDFVKNTEVFQAALEDPAPFSMMKEHLLETGQTWDDFTSSLSGSDAAMFSEMVQRTSGSYPVLDKAAESAQKIGTAFTESASGAADFTAQFNGINDAVVETNKSIKETGAILEETGKSSKGGGGLFGGLFGGAGASEDVVSPFMGLLNDVMMPLMAVQMVGAAFSAVGQGIYDNAAIAEGAGAHMTGSFTGAVDIMSANINKAKQDWSESFGQGVLPGLNGFNNGMATTPVDGGRIDIMKGLGMEAGMLGDVLAVGGGGLLGGLAKIVTLNPGNTFGNDWITGGMQGIQNYRAGFLGEPEPYPGPPVPQMNPMQGQIDQLNALANNPEYLAAQTGYQSAYGKAVKAQEAWDTSHYSGTTGPSDWQNEILQYQAVTAAGGTYGNLTDPNAIFFGWNDYINGRNGPTAPGCFPSGTRVLMANRAEKPIEQIQVGDMVLAHDGVNQVATTVLALIRPRPKQVHRLTFDDGNTLTTTDSHPLAGADGWKALSVEHAKQENPDLPISALVVGDIIYTVDGTAILMDICPLQGVVTIFNIEVSGPHTFYAEKVLVHNKASYGSMGGGLNYSGGGGGGGIDWGGIGNNIGGFFGGIGKSISDMWNAPNGGADTLGMLFSPQAWGFGGGDAGMPAGPVPILTGGCFVAGTPVLMADGTQRSIEMLQVDERVLAHDGKRQVSATIVGCISFPAKQTYVLTFDDGNVLTTTDSHPLASVDGWKSILPASTALENPGLPVTTLAVGDNIYTADGTFCRLISIVKRGIEQVFNVTVDGAHTYYASNILVHNAKQGNSIGSMSNDGTGSQQVQVSHTFTANVQWEANNLAKQFTGVAQWAGQGLANTFNGIASWVGQGLANTFNGVTSWVAQGLANTFNGVTNWVAQGLQNTFQGAANWVGQGLSNTFHGAADWVGQGLNNTFKGVASWVGQGLEHTFTGVANWNAQNLNPTFTVNPSVTMLAEGTSDWHGGPAIVGEAGPEVVEHNGQYSLFNQGAALLNLPQGANVYPMKNLGSSGVAQFADGTTPAYSLNMNTSPQSINVSVHLDSQAILEAIGMPLSQNIRVASAMRSY